MLGGVWGGRVLVGQGSRARRVTDSITGENDVPTRLWEKRSTWALCATLVGSFLAVDTSALRAAPSEATFNYLRSTDGGDGFASLRQLDDVDEGLNITQVAAWGGTVHALFDTANDEPGRVFHRRSTDGGATFSDSVRLDVVNAERDPDNAQSTEADLHAEGATVHVAWTGNPVDGEGTPDPCCEDPSRDDIFYIRSTDGGESFPAQVNLTASPRDHNRDPVLAADGDLVALVYEGQIKVDEDGDEYPEDDERGDQVLVRVSPDGGDSWGEEILLSADPFGKQNEPSVGVAGDSVHVVFEIEDAAQSDETGLDAVKAFYVRSTDGGRSFSAPAPLPGQDALFADGVGVAAVGSSVHVVGCRVDDELDPDDPADLLYWRSVDGGASFADPVAIAPSTDPCGKAVIDASEDGTHLHVAAVFDVADEGDVFYVRGTDAGAHWDSRRPLSANPGGSDDPSVSVDPMDPSQVHASWSDETTFLLTLAEGRDLPTGDGEVRPVAPEDVIRYRGGAYELVIDGSDVGLAGVPVDALARLSEREFVLSLARSADVPGLGPVEPADLILFTASRLGEDTEGSFEPYFDGGAIGLDAPLENIDAVDVLDGDLYLSTTGDFTAGSLTGTGDDILICTGVRTGSRNGCRELSIGLRASDAGLGGLGVDAFSFHQDGNGPEGGAFLSLAGDFSLPEADGDATDVIACRFPEVDDEADDPAPETDLGDCGGEPAPLRVIFRGGLNGLAGSVNAVDLPKSADDEDDG